MYYNPGALALGEGTFVFVEGSFAWRSVTYDRATGAIDHPNAMPGTPDLATNSGEASLSNLIVSPFVGVRSDFGVPGLGVALGFYTPIGGQAEWDKNDAFEGNATYPGAVDGPQRWHNINGMIRSSYVTAAGAYKIPAANLSVGVGVNLVLSVINTIRASNVDGTDDVVDGGGGLQEGRAWVDSSGTSFSFGAGVAWQPTPELVVGLSYQTQPGFGEISNEGTLSTKFGTLPASETPVLVYQSLPDILRLGASYRVTPAVELRLWGSYERWSNFKKQCIVNSTVASPGCELTAEGRPADPTSGVLNNIPREWDDGISLRASGSYFLNPGFELVAGVGWDQNVVPDKTQEASLPDWTDLTATIGANFDAGPLDIRASLLGVFSLTREVEPSDPPPFQPPSRVPDGAGTYDQLVLVLQLGVGYKF
jgi:long-subunit fatty acid transport protein